MSNKFKPPRKTLPKRSLLPEPSSGESSADDEANEVETKVPFKVAYMRPQPFGTFNEDDSTDSEETDSDATSDAVASPKKNNDAVDETPNKKRRLNRRKMRTPRRFIRPEAEVNQTTDAKPGNNGGSREAHSD
ncbi:hypothetical protein Bca52824_092996 [Brassica carinata]|uniref:Uncharacterized protein n=1 Tax=Brassica carinata TaxID=52824 RepID=A0A8X7TL65_BRACI|nr:hypothetical protein Bca52824_092996 [Brassica carinata]